MHEREEGLVGVSLLPRDVAERTFQSHILYCTLILYILYCQNPYGEKPMPAATVLLFNLTMQSISKVFLVVYCLQRT
jgi:hypothetical protein